MLEIELLNRYARQIVLRDIGLEGQEKLRNSTVAVVGVGGLGAPASLLLASIGIGKLILIDRDIVSLTDLHRQPLYRSGDVDLPKVEVAEKRLKEINPYIEIEIYPEPLDWSNVDEIVEKSDIVVDGLDSMRARYILNRTVVKHRKPYIFAGAIEMYGNVTTIIPYETPCLECFYYVEDEESLPTCATVGVHPSITTLIASIAVSEATKYLVSGKPSLLNTLLYIDLRTLDFNKIEILRDETCPVCGTNPRGKPKEIELEEVELSCARDGSGIYFVNKLVENLDLTMVKRRLKESGWEITRESRYSLSFKIDDMKSATILKSGVLIGKSKVHSKEIPDFFRDLHHRLTVGAIQTR